MSEPTTCPVCFDGRAKATRGTDPNGVARVQVDCLLCGAFEMPDDEFQRASAVESSARPPFDARLAAHLRKNTDLGQIRPKLTFDDLVDPSRLGLASLPTTQERIDRLLQMIAQRTPSLGETIELRDVDFARIGARTCYELWELVAYSATQGWIVRDHLLSYDESKERNSALLDGGYAALRLLAPGFVRAEELARRAPKGRKAFVAMWFSSDMDAAWRDGLAPALCACGYEPTRIDVVEHNQKICDAILAEIRAAALVICDFTGSRGGVYFEAGFAMGLGIPVIWSCRADDVEHLHFDTRQYNHIVWDDVAELRDRLEKRIRATVPQPSE